MSFFDSFFKGKSSEQKPAQSLLDAERENRIDAAKRAIYNFYADVAPKWEYLTLRASYTEKDKAWKIIYKGEKRPYADFDEILDELGSRGWELVGMTSSISSYKPSGVMVPLTDTTSEMYVFKRPNPVLPSELAQALRDAENLGR